MGTHKSTHDNTEDVVINQWRQNPHYNADNLIYELDRERSFVTLFYLVSISSLTLSKIKK